MPRPRRAGYVQLGGDDSDAEQAGDGGSSAPLMRSPQTSPGSARLGRHEGMHPEAPYSHSPRRSSRRRPPIPSTPSSSSNQQGPFYVLAPDGSRLYAVDPYKPPDNEAPPPYAVFDSPSRPRASSSALRSTPHQHLAVSLSQTSLRLPHEACQGHVHPAVDLEALAAPSGPLVGSIFCGEEEDAGRVRDEEAPLLSDRHSSAGRYWCPIGMCAYWRPLLHLLLINFPFNLLIWPPLLVGTLAGTALLITLPIGAVVWWLTLIIARWAAREETKMQWHFHGSGSAPRPRPIFYRLREHVVDGELELIWDRRSLANSWAMFTDYYSYSALAYFVLIKPLAIFLPTIALVALFPVCFVITPLLPIYLRAARRYGLWQARLAFENI